jgi:hypothetical protein
MRCCLVQVLALLFGLTSTVAYGQAQLNWNFERPLAASLPAPVFAPDSGNAARGRRSLRLTLPAGSPGAQLYLGALPIAAASRANL